MIDETQLAESKAIHRRTGTTFYVATRLLPERVRHATYVLYAFFRVTDEIVDDPNGPPPEVQREELDRIREAALGRRETDDQVLAAFSELRERYGIPDEVVTEFVDAMATDITKRRYETYGELETYMGGSAAAVGEMMTAVMDPDDPETAQPHARALGEAFQLSNFLRDVGEDIVERDRIYLPQTTLDEHGVTTEQIERREMDEAFAAAVASELERTEERYREGVAGIKYLPDDCQFPVLLAAVLYADHHQLIRAHDYDVLSTTPELSTARKLSLLARTRWHWVWNKDPETVFAKVSTVPMPGAMRPDSGVGEPRPMG
ncbi:phytoene/squalene synthase family protein [Halococcus saccharolyticus]|uniref:Phytoene synthase n=1 Tax=Halococcus saccharolyticus DSM 5350 TaxID=1227455 RepID=M0MGH6_9EURY|nr:phytoene/squalene synthase family protein [Halococcus saccharolyticus]EMA44448.1 phytoene synthase [Halococcus saccharolyticus DSM 5350]